MWRNLLITVAILMGLLGLLLSYVMLVSLDSVLFGEYTATINGVTKTLTEPHAGIAAFEVFILLLLLTFTLFAGEAVMRGWKGQPLDGGKINKLLQAGIRTLPPLFGPVFLPPMLILGLLESAASEQERQRS